MQPGRRAVAAALLLVAPLAAKRPGRAAPPECKDVKRPGDGCYTLVQQDDGRQDRVVWPPVCPGPIGDAGELMPPLVLRGTPAGHNGYDFVEGCTPDLIERNLSWLLPLRNASAVSPPPAPPPAVIHVGCKDGQEPAEAFEGMMWLVLGLYMFYGLAHVCEEFLVPALNVLCERCDIPDDVAGATLMAAGCNAPELFASIMGVFIDHTTVGAGTVVGSAPFNLMCICGAASLAVGGRLHLDGWLLLREISFLVAALFVLLTVLRDGRVMWWEALILVILYVVYALVCVNTTRVVELLYYCVHRRSRTSTMASLDQSDALELSVRPRGRLHSLGAFPQAALQSALGAIPHTAREALSSSISTSALARSPLSSPSGSIRARVPHATDGAGSAVAGSVPAGLSMDRRSSIMTRPLERPMELGGGGLGRSMTAPVDARAAGWDLLVEECRKRCDVYRMPAPAWAEPLLAPPVASPLNEDAYAGGGGEGGTGGGSRNAPLQVSSAPQASHVEGIMLKKSRFYSSIRMGSRTWQRRYFVLDDHPTAPLRYMRLDEDGSHPLRQRFVRIDLRKVIEIKRVSDREIHLMARNGRRSKLMVAPASSDSGQSNDPWVAQRWFDEIVLKTDELSKEGPTAAGGEGGGGEADGDDDEDGEEWYALPSSSFGRVGFAITLPLKAAIHLSVPAVHRRGCEKYYPLTLVLSVLWLGLLAYFMTTALDQIGCALAIPSTVMGLTLGAIGTSFPNLYASILTAQAGQAGMAIGQAFGSNTFNLCIGLGSVWLVEAIVGDCPFGALTGSGHASCSGCYMPSGFAHSCPHLETFRPPPVSGSLAGTSIVVFFNLLLLLLTFGFWRCSIPKLPAYGFFVVYAMYVLYQVAAVYEVIPPICFGDICL